MATDGVKIIDGDTAHDTYWGIMDLYDSGAEPAIIDKEFPISQIDSYDDFENEIYVTSRALALWEIGQLTIDELAHVRMIIDKGACVNEWRGHDEKSAKARQRELEKFWVKINQANPKIRGRKKYRKITNYYFQPDDLLTFQLKDGNYKAVICAKIDQYRGQCNYIFVPTTYDAPQKPTIEDLWEKEILGREIGSGYSRETTKEMQPGIERIWSLRGKNSKFFFGVTALAVDHRDLINFKDRFEKVGVLKIIEGLKNTGTFGYDENFERFESIFGDLENYIKAFGEKKFPVSVLCEA